MNNINVLVVDDSPEDRQMYQRYLLKDKTKSYALWFCEYAKEGLDFCQSEWPDLIILDFLLPDLNGIQFIEALTEIATVGGASPLEHRRLPAILVLTGQGNEEIAVTLMKKGVEDYLIKNNLTELNFQAAIHRIVSQLELRESLEIQQECQRLVSEVALRVRKSLVLSQMLTTAVEEIKHFLNCDRTIVYQFDADWVGKIVAEATDSQWKSALDAQIVDTCFTETKALQYQQGRQLAIVDIDRAGLAECHARVLKDFQVRSMLVVPILVMPEEPTDLPRLWGLLICHQCQAPREWSDTAIKFLDRLAVQLAIAIYQAELVQKLDWELAQRAQLERDLIDRTQQQEWLIRRLGKTTSQLEQRNQDLDSFVAIASHDLRAPLRAVKNLATWLGEDLVGVIDTEAQQQFNILILRVCQMEALLNDLLEYARLGRSIDRETTVNVRELLTDVIRKLEISPEFSIEIPADLPTLSTNRTALDQIFGNLLGNAVKHHPRPDGKVEITHTCQGEVDLFEVIDDGAGIDPKHHQAIFEIFTTFNQADSIDSTGIGLAIVKKLVELQGGTISIVSAPGQGTKFSFTWPLSKENLDLRSFFA